MGATHGQLRAGYAADLADLEHRPASRAQLLARRQSLRRRGASGPLAEQELLTMTGRVLHSSDYQRMPWKNGGGTTTEIWKAASADGEMLWRLQYRRCGERRPLLGVPRHRPLHHGDRRQGHGAHGRWSDRKRLDDLFQPFAFPAMPKPIAAWSQGRSAIST
jgi:hypothetical protein